MNEWTGWLICGAALIHVTEEYLTGWPDWAQRFAKGVNTRQFVFVNILFLLCCLVAVVYPHTYVWLSLAALILVNSLMHILPTIWMRHYSPGLLSSIFLYIPLGSYTYYSVMQETSVSAGEIAACTIAGIGMMLVPVSYQIYVRGRRSNKIVG